MSHINYQENILKILATTKMPVSIYLVNGIRLQGIIDEQDQYTLLLKNNNLRQLVYKHAITTILPSQALPDFTTEPVVEFAEDAL